jgi:hypothetical protein
MTFKEAIDEVQDYFRDVQGVNFQMARRAVKQEYERLHRKYLFPATVRFGDTATWTSGTSLDPSTDITTWRGQPLIDGMRVGTDIWAKVSVSELSRRRGETDDTDDEGKKVFALSGSAPTINVVDAVVSSTLTVDHFGKPTALTALTDVLLLGEVDDSKFEDLVIWGGVEGIEDQLWRNEGRTLTARATSQRLQKVMDDYTELTREAEALFGKERGIRRQSRLPRQGVDMTNRMQYRRQKVRGLRDG